MTSDVEGDLLPLVKHFFELDLRFYLKVMASLDRRCHVILLPTHREWSKLGVTLFRVRRHRRRPVDGWHGCFRFQSLNGGGAACLALGLLVELLLIVTDLTSTLGLNRRVLPILEDARCTTTTLLLHQHLFDWSHSVVPCRLRFV